MNTLIINYARSGGTLISKIIGSLEDVILVSEVNPSGSGMFSLIYQMKLWHNLDLEGTSFLEQINSLEYQCEKLNKSIVIRDFSINNFFPNKTNNFTVSNRLEILDSQFPTAHYNSFAFVRNAYDVWISQKFPKNFSVYYLNYVNELLKKNIPIFKFEDFCNNPEEELVKMCKIIGSEANTWALKNFHLFEKTTGDHQMNDASRGYNSEKIKILKRKQIPTALINSIKSDNKMQEANRLLGYSSQFDDAIFESNSNQLWIDSKWRLKQFKNSLQKYD